MIVKARHYSRARDGKSTNRSKYRKNYNKIRSKGTVSEQFFDEVAKEQGWQSFKNGWPDRLLQNPKTKEVILVEIKSRKSWLTEEQKQMHKALRRAGMEVIVVNVRSQSDKEKGRIKDILFSVKPS